MRCRAEPNDTLVIVQEILSAKWTLPILRVLDDGPARFLGLRTAIPAVSSKILAGRLRNLEEVGIIQKTTLPPPSNCQVYALTEIGEAARPVLQAIEQWASAFDVPSRQRPSLTGRK